jgi:hypothetical protein
MYAIFIFSIPVSRYRRPVTVRDGMVALRDLHIASFAHECDATERALHWKNVDFRIEQLPNHLFKQLWCTSPRIRRRTNIVSEKDEPAVGSDCALDQVMDRTSGQNVWNKLNGTQLPKINASSVHVGPDAAT